MRSLSFSKSLDFRRVERLTLCQSASPNERRLSGQESFPSLRYFAGPKSTFIALSFCHHKIQDIYLREYYGPDNCTGQPSWICDSKDLNALFDAFGRVRPKRIAIGLDMRGNYVDSFWNRLAAVAPNIERLAVTMSFRDHSASTTASVSICTFLSFLPFVSFGSRLTQMSYSTIIGFRRKALCPISNVSGYTSSICGVTK